MSYTQKQGERIRQFYGNDRGIGFFYPSAGEAISGITRVYGLAYIDEGWHELGRGIDRVEITVGGKAHTASLYVKNRYFVFVFDSTDFPDGELEFRASAWDTDGRNIGTVSMTALVCNAGKPSGRRIYASADGSPSGDGSREHPYSLSSGCAAMSGGDVLLLRGGVYREDLVLEKSGSAQSPTVIMACPDEHVEIVGHNVTVKNGTRYAILSGIHQHGTENDTTGLDVQCSLSHISVWDCSFTDNNSPYENEDNPTGYRSVGVGIQNSLDSLKHDFSEQRRYIEFSHVLSTRNDVDAFVISAVQYGRFQFCEGSWSPDATNPVKRKDLHQFRHANGFNSTNTAYSTRPGLASGETTFLFCLSHHNGQDGWDYQSPNPRLFGCVTYGEAASCVPFGGVGFKFWEYNNTLVNCVTYCNNTNDDSGSAMTFSMPFDDKKHARIDTLVANCAFFRCHTRALAFGYDNADHFRLENCVFEWATELCTKDITKNPHVFLSNNLMWNIYDKEITLHAKEKEPGFLDPVNGCFFPKEGAAMLTEGNTLSYSFDVDGVDYTLLDGLGRPRNSSSEAGPYTRYDRDIVEHV